MERIIQLQPLPHEIDGKTLTRKCRIEWRDGGRVLSHQSLWFEMDAIDDFPEEKDSDSYLLALLFDAMLEKRDIVVKGSVSKKLLSNLVEYQAVWQAWLPDLYTRVEIMADQVREDETPKPGAVCAFSGGVDATFTVWRHSQKKWSHRSQDIKMGAMVHGFDIPLRDAEAFANAKRKASETLMSLNIPICSMRTNYRQIAKVNWEYTHAAALVAALNNLKKQAGVCLVGSSFPYDSLPVPWGSSPIADPLLSSGDFEIMHDGASHNRVWKVAEIAAWKTGVENLRVCWQGSHKDRNCGKCEKCLRTICGFLATGHEIPSCFPNDNDLLKNLKNIKHLSDRTKTFWKGILAAANERDIDEPWVRVVSRLVSKKTIREQILPLDSRRRNLAKKLYRKAMNYKDPGHSAVN